VTITKEQIAEFRTWDGCDGPRATAICDLALEALELRALVPTDEEMSNIVRACDGRGFDDRVTDEWLDRVRAWKGSR
jgi:hypothetical protein